MLIRQPDYYSTFRCLGGACPDTCCRDWDIVLDATSIQDYQNAPPPLSSQLAKSLTTDEEGDTCFRLDSQGFCTMLTQDGLCTIQKKWGAEHLCLHCAAYPRFIEEYGCLTESSLALSCPEAARLLLESPSFSLEEADDGHSDPPFPDIPPELMATLELSRTNALDILAQTQHSLWARIHTILRLAFSVQAHWTCLDSSNTVNHNISIPSLSANPHAKSFAQQLLIFFASLDPLRPSWPEQLHRTHDTLSGLSQREYILLCRRFETQFPLWQQHLSNLMGYLMFRHWHKAVNDDQLYARAAWMACSILLLYHLFLIHWMEKDALPISQEIALCCAFSREVEHMEENLGIALDTCALLSPSSIYFPPA